MDESYTDVALDPPSLPPSPKPLRLAIPMLLVLSGMLLLGLLDNRERARLHTVVWKDALIVRSNAQAPDDAIATRTRSIDASNFPDTSEIDLAVNPLLPEIEWNPRERLIALDLPEELWSSLVKSGATPAPNSTEVIAGALCRLETFSVGGQIFTVVGKLDSGTPGLSFSYLCRDNDAVSNVMAEDSEPGWIDPRGQSREPEYMQSIGDENGSVVIPLAPIAKYTSFLSLVGIALIVSGGGVAQIRIFQRLAHRVSFVRWFVHAATEYRGLFITMHVICYGVYFVASIMAIGAPIQNLTLMMLVSDMFTQGDLAHIGEAYMSGSIFQAAWATFWNNFVIQTLLYCIIPSLLVPFIGVLKTALSLLLAGFVLSPIWTGYIGRMTFHTLTLSMECQAYIFAAFAVSAYVFYMVRGILGEREKFRSAARVVMSGTLLAAFVLILAALYEAATLIAWA